VEFQSGFLHGMEAEVAITRDAVVSDHGPTALAPAGSNLSVVANEEADAAPAARRGGNADRGGSRWSPLDRVLGRSSAGPRAHRLQRRHTL
jgi:hypothetical protein